MASLKEHQAAMVDLLANGSGIPASASRLAHATYDILELLILANLTPAQQQAMVENRRPDATTPGLNDVALAQDIKALKVDSPCVKPSPAEVRIKQLENTIRQLKGRVEQLKAERDNWIDQCAFLKTNLDCAENEVMCLRVVADTDPKKAVGYILRANSAMTDSLRKVYLNSALESLNYEPEQAGCRKNDTQWLGTTGGAGRGLSDDGIDPVRSK